MENLLKGLLEEAKKDKVVLRCLEFAAVKGKKYELAAELREIELSNFPQTKAQKEAKYLADRTDGFLRMLGMQVSQPKDAWFLNEGFKLYFEKGGDFDLKDLAKLKTKSDKLFPDSEIK
jgi:hypothetical protein